MYNLCLVALLLAALLARPAWGQTAPPATQPPLPTQTLGDVVKQVLPHRRPAPPLPDSLRPPLPAAAQLAADSVRMARRARRPSLVVLPAVAYTLEARLLATLTASVSFQRPQANLSAISTTLTYTQNRQLILAVNGPLWTQGNHSLWLADHRLLKYPQLTFGLGSDSHLSDAIGMSYNLLRLHQTYYHRVGRTGPLYAGVGYFLDAHWNITATNGAGQAVTEISGYRTGVSGRSTSSGLVLSVLRDSRDNQLRPAAGESYFFAALRTNLRALGSDADYRFVQFDGRRYFQVGRKYNVLAFWLYGDFAIGQAAPYLDLPATGWDTYSVTGRGYIQGRFRGTSLVVGEGEFRFNLTRSRVLGGAVFANAQTARHPTTGYGRLAPGGGAGLRVALSHKANTYLAVDYAVGLEGSGGVFFNLGEVF